jgi:hypothetical protein
LFCSTACTLVNFSFFTAGIGRCSILLHASIALWNLALYHPSAGQLLVRNYARPTTLSVGYIALTHSFPPFLFFFSSAILNANHRVSVSHCTAGSIKTDAPASVLFDILRAWVKDHPVSKKQLTETSIAGKILAKEPR